MYFYLHLQGPLGLPGNDGNDGQNGLKVNSF